MLFECPRQDGESFVDAEYQVASRSMPMLESAAVIDFVNPPPAPSGGAGGGAPSISCMPLLRPVWLMPFVLASENKDDNCDPEILLTMMMVPSHLAD